MATHPFLGRVDRTPLIGQLTIRLTTRKTSVLHFPYRELPVADPGAPDTRSPLRYLIWLARHQKTTLFFNAFFGIGWMVSQALVWTAVGVAIDRGITDHSQTELFRWVGIVMALGLIQAVCGSLRHQMAVTNWMQAAYRTVQVVGKHISVAGTALTDEIPSGDIVNTVAADAMRIGGAYDVLARFIGSIVAWIVVSLILLSTSVELGLIVLIGVPVLAAFTIPLMRPLHAAQSAQREAAGRLAALGSDTVAGLRILRGVGGEDVFLENYRRQSDLVRRSGNRIATPQAGLESGQVLLPAILTAIITFLGAHDVRNGTLQPGQLVAFFGYATFLTTPLRTAIEYVISTTRAYVGAGKVLRILRVAPRVEEPSDPSPWPHDITQLEDVRSGVTLYRGEMVGLVTDNADDATIIADRLGRFVTDVDDVLVNDVALNTFSVHDTRSNIVVSEIEPRLFSGELRYELVPHGMATNDNILQALEAASAMDILDALDDGLNTEVEERARSFSGGQRQRLSLARALLRDAEVLILVDPTSAVDTHTEGRIATRLRDAREGRTTLIATTSPLMLQRMDRIYVYRDGHVVAEGTHSALLETSLDYRQIVLREDAS